MVLVLSDTLRYINLTEVVVGLFVLCEPMHLCTCVREERGDRGSDRLCCLDQLTCVHV
jgi:hypothetical protein